MMYLFGNQMVRGGSYSFLRKLNENQEKFLLMEKKGALDLCFECGDPDHFADQCTHRSEFISKLKKSLKKPREKLNQIQKEEIVKEVVNIRRQTPIQCNQLNKNIMGPQQASSGNELEQNSQKNYRSRQKRKYQNIKYNSIQISRSEVLKFRHLLQKQQQERNKQIDKPSQNKKNKEVEGQKARISEQMIIKSNK